MSREELFGALIRRKRLRPRKADTMPNLHQSGFNVHAIETVLPTDRECLEKVERYKSRAALALDRM